MISIIISAYNSEKTIAQATAAIDELHDSNAYNFSTTNAAVPNELVCSDGTIYTQSLFNS